MVPNAFCLLTSLQQLYLSSNPSISCAPACVSSISISERNVPSQICVYSQDYGLCGLITATNIQSITSYGQWSCASAGYTSSTPCGSAVWPGLTCNGINIISINLSAIGLTGLFRVS